MLNLKPTGHHILVKPDPIEETTESGIIIYSDEMQKKRDFFGSTKGEVIAIGPTCWMAYDYDKPGWKPWCKVGDRVEFTSNVSKIIRDKEDVEYFLMTDQNILAVDEE